LNLIFYRFLAKLSGVWANPPKPTPAPQNITEKNALNVNPQPVNSTGATPSKATNIPPKPTLNLNSPNPPQITSPVPATQDQPKQAKEQTQKELPKQTQPPVKVTSWSGLFANVTPPPLPVPVVQASGDKVEKSVKEQEDKKSTELSSTLNGEEYLEYIYNFTALLEDFDPFGSALTIPDLVPRGLMNPRNKCFLNVIIQLLFGCKGFWKLMQVLKTVTLPPKYETLAETYLNVF
jgi:hypothetical protein